MKHNKRSGISRLVTVLVLLGCLLLCTQASAASASTYARISKKTVTKASTNLLTPKIHKVANLSTGVKLYWKKISGASGYYIYRAYPNSSYYTRIKTITSSSVVSYTDKTTTSGRTYVYTIMAYKKSGSGVSVSNCNLAGKTITFLNSPKITNAVDTRDGISLTWSKVPTGAGYTLYRKEAGDSDFKTLATITLASTTTYMDTSAQVGKSYLYGIRTRKKYAGTTYQSSLYTYPQKATHTLTPPIYADDKKVYRALLVGESIYDPFTYDPENPVEGTGNLYGPSKDVRVMRSMLNDMNYSSCVVIENVGKEAILQAIIDTFSKATGNDVSLFYYSGHGSTEANSANSGALSLPGASTASEYLTLAELATALRAVPGRVIVILDSCGSGAAVLTSAVGAGADTKGSSDTFDPEAFNQMVTSAFAKAERSVVLKYAELADSSKFSVITASRAFQYSMEYMNDNSGDYAGALTMGLVQGAGFLHETQVWNGLLPADLNGDKAISLEEAYNYASGLVSRLAWPYESNQNVQRYPVNSSFVLYYR